MNTSTAPAMATKEAPTILTLLPDELEPWPRLNPRRRHDDVAHAELVASIKAEGVLEPLLVHDRSDDSWGEKARPPWTGKRYWIVAGERRWRAAVAAGAAMPCLVRHLTEEQALRIALIENLHRRDMTPIEEARAFQRLVDAGLKPTQLAQQIGLDRSTVSNRIRLLQLPDAVLELIEDGRLELAHARDLLLPFAQIPQAKRAKLYGVIAKKLNASKGRADEREVGQIVADQARELSRPIGERVAYGDTAPEFGAKKHLECKCQGPKFRYGHHWDEKSVRCFDDQWWEAAQTAAIEKREAAEKRAAAKLAAKGAAGDVAVMSDEAFRKKHGYQAALGASRELVDASVLHDAPIAVVKSRWGGPEVHCLDDAALKKAKSAVTKERNRLIAERKAERAAKDRAEAAELAIEPWMLAEILTARPQNDTMLDVGRELGLDVGKHGELHERVKKMSADDVKLLFVVLALRSKRHVNLWRDPLAEEVDKRLRKKYTPGLTALKKWALEAAGIDPKAAAEEPDDDDVEVWRGPYVDENECIVCGCTDSEACIDGCEWLALQDIARLGVCSSCAESEDEALRMLNEHLEGCDVEELVEA